MTTGQVLVGMGEIQTIQGETELSVPGVGSGVVLAAYDQVHQIGACAHFILPEPPEGLEHARPGKYVRGGVMELIRKMAEMGAATPNIRTAILGGAGVVLPAGGANGGIADLGMRNVAATLEAIGRLGLPCMAQDVGGQLGRSMTFCVKSGTVKVRAGNQPDHILCRLRGR